MKPAGVPELALLLLCSAVTLILFFFFSLSPSVSQDQSILGSTYEMIMKAKSSPVFAFFICNLIVVVIFLESSTSFHPEFEWFGSLSPSENVDDEDKGEANNKDDEDNNNNNNDEDEEDYFHGYDGYEEDNDDGSSEDNDDDSDSEVEEDDDLERRIEEFIAKINGSWRAEWLMEMLPT